MLFFPFLILHYSAAHPTSTLVSLYWLSPSLAPHPEPSPHKPCASLRFRRSSTVSSAPAHYSRPVWLGTQHCLLWVNDSLIFIFLLILFSMISVLDISPGVTYCHIKSSNLRSLPLLLLAHLFNGSIIFNNLTNHLVPQAWISEVTFDSFLFCITYIQDVSQVLQQYPSDLTFWKLLKCSPADSTFEVSRGCVCWLITTLMHSDRYRIDA